MTRASDQVGRQGEKAAARLLKQAGYRIAAKNYRCPLGEIDLVALDGDELVFVEVKARTADDQADPEQQVNPRKQSKLRLVARQYVHATKSEDRPCRFDVVAVVLPEKGKPQLRHYKDAF